MQKITPNLWFDTQAKEAAGFYTSIFKNSKITDTALYGKEAARVSGMSEGSIMQIEFQLEGYHFTAINGGPVFKMNPSVSFSVGCETREEIDTLWSKLVEGGSVPVELDKYPYSERYGWLQDKYGLSWQVVPGGFSKFMKDPDPVRKERVMKVFFQMKKIDIAALERAYEGK